MTKKPMITCTDGLFLMNGIPLDIDASIAAARLKIPSVGEEFRALSEMLAEAVKTGSPKAVYRICYPESRTEDSVVIDAVKLKSRVLSVNLEKAHRVFLYVITCGMELEDWSKKYDDPLLAYFADFVKESALSSAVDFFYRYIGDTYRIPKFSKMAPGSLKDWPLEEQKPFFRIMGKVRETAGVTLTESCLMQPSKSVSGILFPTETTFESCMLCPREKCPGRRATYNPGLYENKYYGGGAADRSAKATK